MKLCIIVSHILWLLPSFRILLANEADYLKFPEGFLIGTASSAYQTEGAWNVSSKGVSVWDWLTHEKPSLIADGSNGDVACDSYHKYKEDVETLRNIGFDHYRFSLSWSRILPTGFPNKISRDGLQYYKNLIDELRAKGIEPFVTIYHWDHPELLQRMGAWTNELIVDYFADFARIVFRELGPKVKYWVTINEINNYCGTSYDSLDVVPGMNETHFGNYICLHNMLKAHARAYHIYNDEFRPNQNGTIGVSISCAHHFPKFTNDSVSAKVAFEFDCGAAGHPIFSENGDYSDVMKQRIKENSRLQGLPRSKLPEFSPYWVNYIKGSADFFGLNHYTSYLTESVPRNNDTEWCNDSGILKTVNSSWPSTPTEWLKVVPEGFGGILRDIKKTYNNPPVYVLENGVSDREGLDDQSRVKYVRDYMREMLLAVNRDACNVKAYTIWSFLDNFEWYQGYTQRFGIIHVDFTSPNRTRIPRTSASALKEILTARTLVPSNYTNILTTEVDNCIIDADF